MWTTSISKYSFKLFVNVFNAYSYLFLSYFAQPYFTPISGFWLYDVENDEFEEMSNFTHNVSPHTCGMANFDTPKLIVFGKILFNCTKIVALF